jgi:ABC-2 type transport system ATP-binding protein
MQLCFSGVTKRFGGVLALDHLTCTIEPGEIVAVLGANGAGKSTLLKLLASILAPSAGEIRIDGEVLNRQRIDLRQRIAFLPDAPPHIGPTPLRYMSALLEAYDADTVGCEDRAAAILGELDMLPLAECGLRLLSRGQQYKAALAALLVLDPEIWLLDEPLAAGMDPQGISVLKRYATKAAARGATILYTTQIVELAEQFSDRVLVFDRGRLHAFDSVQNLARQHGTAERVLDRVLAGLRSS